MGNDIKVAVAYFKALAHNWIGGTEENHKEHFPGQDLNKESPKINDLVLIRWGMTTLSQH
jgi:hypothetical protein